MKIILVGSLERIDYRVAALGKLRTAALERILAWSKASPTQKLVLKLLVHKTRAQPAS